MKSFAFVQGRNDAVGGGDCESGDEGDVLVAAVAAAPFADGSSAVDETSLRAVAAVAGSMPVGAAVAAGDSTAANFVAAVAGSGSCDAAVRCAVARTGSVAAAGDGGSCSQGAEGEAEPGTGHGYAH